MLVEQEIKFVFTYLEKKILFDIVLDRLNDLKLDSKGGFLIEEVA